MRPTRIWIIFGLSFCLLLGAMAWVSHTAIHLEQTQLAIEREAAFNEKVRLALWRMESSLAPLVLQESSRPYFMFTPFYPAERAYDRMFSELQPNEILLPSPLLKLPSTNVLLHFQYGPDGQLSSPQVPHGDNRALAESGYASRTELAEASARLTELTQLLDPETLLRACASPLSTPAGMNAQAEVTDDSVAQPGGLQGFAQNMVQTLASQAARPQIQEKKISEQQSFNQKESLARATTYREVRRQIDLNNALARPNIAEGVTRPVWLGEALVLARRVTAENQHYIQGCWLDWPNLQQSLLAGIDDLLPAARLEPALPAADTPQENLLASLPVRLLPGPVPTAAIPTFSPVRYALLIAWLCILLAGSAGGALLHGAITLSERRGAFVSAVTHELRTPLTTFKMYSEMLAADMLATPEQRRQYLQTLCSEADRLGHLVENVLAYARLERGSARRQLQPMTVRGLLDHVKPRLLQRCTQTGLALVTEVQDAVRERPLSIDVFATEQILFNLVDNACKYGAREATRREIQLTAQTETAHLLLTIRDFGQGVSEPKRLFQPFAKSADQAAVSAPGIGLGLALCQRLSRELGGSLRLERNSAEGATFALRLPWISPD